MSEQAMDGRPFQPGDKVFVCLDVLDVVCEDTPIPGAEHGLYLAKGTLKLGWNGDPTTGEGDFVYAASHMVINVTGHAIVGPDELAAIGRLHAFALLCKNIDTLPGDENHRDEAKYLSAQCRTELVNIAFEDLAIVEEIVLRTAVPS